MLRKFAKFTLIASFVVSAAIAIYGLSVAKKAESIELILCFFIASSVVLVIAFGVYLLFNRIEDNHELLQKVLICIEEDQQKQKNERELERAKRIADEVDKNLGNPRLK